MAYKRWRGNTGRGIRVPTPGDEGPGPSSMPSPPSPPPPPPPPPPPIRPPPPHPGIPFAGESLEGLLSRLDPGRLEREDWLVLGILWLLYRLSGDTELLIALGLYLIL